MTRPPSDELFAELVASSWGSLYRTAFLMLGDHAEAEDLVQTALARTYASWARVREPAAASAYARRTLHTTAATWFRRRSWRNERPTERLPEPRTSYDGSGASDDLSLRPTLMQALDRLAPRQRAVVVLRFYEDLSVAETAAALRVSAGTVKSQTSDALARLRDLLGDDVVPASLATPGGNRD